MKKKTFLSSKNANTNLWSQPAVAAILPSDRTEVPDMPGRSKLISFLTTHEPYVKYQTR